MTDLEPLGPDEVLALPAGDDLALVIGGRAGALGTTVPKDLMDGFLDLAGFAGGGFAAKSLLDGSLVKLAPQTIEAIKDGAVFAVDKQGWQYGTLKIGKEYSNAVRCVGGGVNPVAAGLLVQTMAVQRQLGQIQDALEEIDKKLDQLIRGAQNEVQAELIARGHAVNGLAAKVADGHALTATDDNQLANHAQVVDRIRRQAAQHVTDMRALLRETPQSPKQHLDALDASLDDHHVAFWLRVFLGASIVSVQILGLRLRYAFAVEPEYAADLRARSAEEMTALVEGIFGLVDEMHAYLTATDLAAGIAETRVVTKMKLRRRRREFAAVFEPLRAIVEGSQETLESLLDEADRGRKLPPALTRRDYDPRVIRDGMSDGATAFATRSLTTAERVLDRAHERVSDMVQEREDSDVGDALAADESAVDATDDVDGEDD